MAFRELIPFGRERRPVPGGGGEHSIEGFRREMDRLFDDFFRAPTTFRPGAWFGGDVRVDVSENRPGVRGQSRAARRRGEGRRCLARQQRPDDPGREEVRAGGEEEGLLPERALLRVLPARHPARDGRRRGQGGSPLRQGRVDDPSAQVAAGPGHGPTDRGKRQLIPRAVFFQRGRGAPLHGPGPCPGTSPAACSPESFVAPREQPA